MKRKNIYITFTPYHIFLASMIAMEKSQDENILWAVTDFNAEQMIIALNKSKVFSKCIVLPGLYKQKKHRNGLRKKNAKQISRLIENEQEVQYLFLGTDTRIEGQTAAYKAKRIASNVNVIVMEDGGDFYNSEVPPDNKSLWKQLHSKLVFGKWYEDVKTAGLYSKTDELKMIFPQLARKEILHKKRTAIFGHYCFSSIYQEFVQQYWSLFEQEKHDILKADGILMIAYSGYGKQHDQYPIFIKKICESASLANLKLIVKYHPREEDVDYCHLKTLPNVILTAEQIPAEFMYALKSPNLKFIIGDISSALMTAKWLLKDQIEVYSTAAILGVQDRLLDVFQQLGIYVVKDLKEVDFRRSVKHIILE